MALGERALGVATSFVDADKITHNSGGTAGFFGQTPIVQRADASQVAITDSTTGTSSDTLAAGAGIYQVSFPYDLADIADGDLVTDYVVGHKFKILSLKWTTTKAATTAAKDSDITMDIGSTAITTIAIALDSDDGTTDTLGGVTTIDATALNTGSATATISIVAASTVAFIEGSGVFTVEIQNMDTADAMASIADKWNELRTTLVNFGFITGAA